MMMMMMMMMNPATVGAVRWPSTAGCRLRRPELTAVASMSIVAELPVLEYDERLNGVLSCRSGTTLNIDVNFSGYPDPAAEWFFNGTPLSSSGVQAGVQTDAWHTGLALRNVRPTEAGLYKVKVANKAGAKTATFTVEVKGPSTKSAAAVLRSCSLWSWTVINNNNNTNNKQGPNLQKYLTIYRKIIVSLS